jgi:hypothetical protein
MSPSGHERRFSPVPTLSRLLITADADKSVRAGVIAALIASGEQV